MLQLPKNKAGLWPESLKPQPYRELNDDLAVDVAVVGGGICGISSAYLLKQAGLKVAVIEKKRIGSGTSGRTTGKVTSQHGLMYADLAKKFGDNTAWIYGKSNQSAIDKIIKNIKDEKIYCDWQSDDNYVFTTRPGQIPKFRSEAKTAARLGLPASFEKLTPLPFKVAGAVKFENQAKFNSQKYINGLAKAISSRGSFIFENSRIISIRDGSPARVSTKHAHIYAKDVIIATNVPTFPLLARGAYCVLEYPRTSYIVAGPYDGKLKGMYISPDENHHSILPVKVGNRNMLLIGGNDHIRGPRNGNKRFQELADYGVGKLGLTAVKYKWSAWDYLAYDSIPLVGKLYPWSKHLFVATAFKKWGLTNTTVAAMILRDTLTGKKNAWADTYNSLRAEPIKSIPSVAIQTFK
jgi:glycine/D-amino acid oxidase-like deaminating enzyme